MTKQKQTEVVDANDFAQVIAALGFTINIVGLALPKGDQQELALAMGDDLIHLLLKYSSDDKREELMQIKNMLMTEQADTTVAN